MVFNIELVNIDLFLLGIFLKDFFQEFEMIFQTSNMDYLCLAGDYNLV